MERWPSTAATVAASGVLCGTATLNPSTLYFSGCSNSDLAAAAVILKTKPNAPGKLVTACKPYPPAPAPDEDAISRVSVAALLRKTIPPTCTGMKKKVPQTTNDDDDDDDEASVVEPLQTLQTPRGSISPSTLLSSFPRRYKAAVVTQHYTQKGPELDHYLKGRPKLQVPAVAPPGPVPTTTTITTTRRRRRRRNNEDVDLETSDNLSDNQDPSSSLSLSTATTWSGRRQEGGGGHNPTTNKKEQQGTRLRQEEKKDQDRDHSIKEPTFLKEQGKQEQSCSSPASNNNHGVCHKMNQGPARPACVVAVASWTTDPPALRVAAWSETPAHEFNVRGPTYLQNGIKIASEPAVLQLFCVDLVKVKQPLPFGISGCPTERIQTALKREQMSSSLSGGSQHQAPMKLYLPAFVFVVNLILPAAANNDDTTSSAGFYHFCLFFGTNNKTQLQDESTPFGKLANRFFFGNNDKDNNEYRNAIFKLIPRVTQGNFVVRTAVGGKPTLLGQKLKQSFLFHDDDGNDRTHLVDLNHCHGCHCRPCHCHRRYMEMMIDIPSNPVANRIVKLVLGYAKTLAVDLMFLLQGGGGAFYGSNNNNNSRDDNDNSQTLPERILGGVRLQNVDFANQDGQRMVAAADVDVFR